VATYVETARHQWEEGSRRLAAAVSDPDAYEILIAQVEAVTEELRRRIGEHFTLAQLADLYGGDDGWVYEAVAERADRPGWTARVSVAQDAAFHLYARGATDYVP
jgi:cobyrinic acid a,c-diamide synthase